jgi:DNA-binding CsgD family transcriptional regulator
VRDRHPLILDPDADLAAMAAAVTAAAGGHGTLILLHGPAGSGRTTMVRAAGAEAAARGVRTLTARGLPLERGFPYGIVRQLLEPARAAVGPAEWDALLDGAATGGNPFLLAALINAVRPLGGAGLDEALVLSAGPPSVADAVARRTGQLGPGAAALIRALAVLGRPASLRHVAALALAELGAHRRRAGRRGDAREPLRRALDYAERTGAERLRGYARAELLAVGARPRRAALTGPDALTRAEREVAALAAEGRSNRQIARQLYITRATVETHLRHAFRKLGIRSRSDLPARLARGRE